jgi:mRNA interferase YafQ
LNIVWTGQFKKDYKRVKKQGKDPNDLRSVVKMLTGHEPLLPKHRDHNLCGHWNKHRECRIAPDWLLIYRIEGDDLILERTGSHSELFG